MTVVEIKLDRHLSLNYAQNRELLTTQERVLPHSVGQTCEISFAC